MGQITMPGLVLTDRLRALVAAPVDAGAIAALLTELDRVVAPPATTLTRDAALARTLRLARQLTLMALMERDLTGVAPLAEVTGAMTALAEQTTGLALRCAAIELVHDFGMPCDRDGLPQDLLVVGMGKAGGGELNVSSDLDLVFIYRDEGQTGSGRIAASEFMHRLARRTIALLAETTADGFVFRIDTRLRPNGDAGPLVCSMPMLEDYFVVQGREWERLAWLKARVIADSGLAGGVHRADDEAGLLSVVNPFVFRRYLDYRSFAALRDLHARIRGEVIKRDLRHEGSIDVKLGRGGIREIEFIAQLFQVVRGGRDPGLRDKRTLTTLTALATRNLIPPAEIAQLTDAYLLLRRVEHMLQYQEDQQTHRLDADPAQHARIAAMLGLAAADFDIHLEQARIAVWRVFDSLLAESEPATGGTPDAPVGFSEAVAPRVTALREGPRYRAAREDTRATIDRLLAAAIEQRADDEAMKRFIDLLETICGRSGYLMLLKEYPAALERVLLMLGKARWAAEYLTRHPIVLDELLDGQLLEPTDLRRWADGVREAVAQAVHNDTPDVERQMDIVREAHHAQVFRVLTQDLEGRLTVERVADLLSELADRVLDIALDVVWSQLRQRHRDRPRFAIIGYGKLGGKELGYASDLDLVFVHEDNDEQAQPAYSLLAQRLAGWLSTRTAAGLLFEIDLRLRPNGNAGLLVTSLKSFIDYQRESAWVWEHQALSRARFCAGDPDIGARFEQTRRELLAQPRDPAKLRVEVLAMRQKMHDGHPNKTDRFDLKHDRGGMVDIEFVVQYLVLAHSHRYADLLDNVGNIALLRRAGAHGLIDRNLAARCADAYRRYRQLQHEKRLNEIEYARVDPQVVAGERDSVRALWDAVLRPEAARP